MCCHVMPSPQCSSAKVAGKKRPVLRSQLSSRLVGVELPETLIFDFPTLRQIEAHIAPSAAPTAPEPGGNALLQLLSSLSSCGPNAPPPSTSARVSGVGAAVQAVGRELVGSAVSADAPLIGAFAGLSRGEGLGVKLMSV